jgi:signal transduction histidine kinase
MRARLLLALVATSAVTLLAAAGVLLGPLQNRLRSQTRHDLQAAVQSARPEILAALRRSRSEADGVATRLHLRTNADVIIFDFADATPNPPPGDDEPAATLYRLYIDAHPKTTVEQSGSAINIAMPLRPGKGTFYVLNVHKQDTNLTQVVREVRKAFITAALIGLAVALALGLVISTTLSRRLGRLRQTAQRIVREGPDAPAPIDTKRDDVGALARAMAEMQDALRRQESARRHFVATASHELRTPLTSLIGTLELLAEDLDAPAFDVEDAKAQVLAAQNDLQRLRALASELLDLSRLDAGVELRSEPVELGELTRAVAAEFELQAAARGNTLDVVAPPGPCWASGDPDAVARIVRILIDNALRYCPRGSAVSVVAAYQGDHATLAVSDNGPGVSAGEHDAIFERFRRGSHGASASGFGLGLAIGRELATQLGGTLTLDEAHQPGARFVLELEIELPRGGQEDEAASGSRSYSVDGGVR